MDVYLFKNTFWSSKADSFILWNFGVTLHLQFQSTSLVFACLLFKWKWTLLSLCIENPESTFQKSTLEHSTNNSIWWQLNQIVKAWFLAFPTEVIQLASSALNQYLRHSTSTKYNTRCFPLPHHSKLWNMKL